MEETKLEICTCGHGEDMHVDGCEQCFDIECGCKEFEEREKDEPALDSELR